MKAKIPVEEQAQLNAAKVRESLTRLEAAALKLNEASDLLAVPVGEIDARLKKLTLGINVWHTCQTTKTWVGKIGYAKVNSHWGLAISQVLLDKGGAEVKDTEQQWEFMSAPRWMRVDYTHQIPVLLEEMVERALHVADQMRKTTMRMQGIADGVKE